jgi:branched-chain amino acid transport system permease protein
VTTFVLLTITGLGLGAMYFLIASGLSLIYGLMGVLNFAHGAFITVGSYSSWWLFTRAFDGVDPFLLRFLLSALCGLVAGAAFAALVELVLIRPLYQRHIEQVLVTVGLSIAFVALVQGIWGPDAHAYPAPA